jgi:RNA polymerase sigma-70 factor (ECF subfamily)
VAQSLAEVFQQHARHPGARTASAPDLEPRLRALVDASRVAWPGLDVAPDAFVRRLAEHLPDEGDLDACLARMHGPDLYLACGCAAGSPAALEAFDGQILSQAVPVLQRMRLPAAYIDDVIQVVRAKLLVADERGEPPLISTYAGRGALVGWVRTAARRTALSMRRNMDEKIGGGAAEGRAAERLPVPVDLELDYIKNRYRAEFKQAVEDAIAALGADHLKVLRLHYADGLSIDRIGALLGVHRATAARWIRAAADAVRDEARRLLHERLHLPSGELDSLAGLVQSQLHLSLGRLLESP